MPLGMKVGFVPDDIVLDGDPAPTERGTTAHRFAAHFALARSPISATAELLLKLYVYIVNLPDAVTLGGSYSRGGASPVGLQSHVICYSGR